jgi:hypothetical protein
LIHFPKRFWPQTWNTKESLGNIEQILLLYNFKILIFESVLLFFDQFWGWSATCLEPSLHFKKMFYVKDKLQRKPSVGRVLKFFIFQPYEFENLRFLTNARWGQELNASFTKTYRLMAWITKSPIWGNHWVPLGCRALLGSVKSWFC